MADENPSIVVGILEAIGVAIGLVGTGYVCYQLGHADGYKEGFPDGVGLGKEKTDELIKENERLRAKLGAYINELRALKEDQYKVVAWAREKGYINNGSDELASACRKVDEEILTAENVRNALGGEAAKGVLKASLAGQRVWQYYDGEYSRHLGQFVGGEFRSGDIKAPIVYFGKVQSRFQRPEPEDFYAELKIPELKFGFKQQVVDLSVCKEIVELLRREVDGSCITADGEIDIKSVIAHLLSRWDGNTVQCERIIREVGAPSGFADRPPDLVLAVADGDRPYNGMSSWRWDGYFKNVVQSKQIDDYLRQGVAELARKVSTLYSKVLVEKKKDDQFLEQNKSLWIRLSKRKEIPVYRWDCRKTSQHKGEWCVNNNEFQIEQESLLRYTLVFTDDSEPVPTAIDDIKGLYQCNIIEKDEANLLVYIRSKELIKWQNQIPRIRKIRQCINRMKMHKIGRRSMFVGVSYNMNRENHFDERQIESIWQRLDDLTSGGWDLENCLLC